MTATSRPCIVHVVDDLEVGGLQRKLFDLVQQTRDRFDHAVYCIRHRGSFAEQFEGLGVPVTAFNKKQGHEWFLWLRLARQFRTLRPDIVHARNWGTIDAIVGAFSARVPTVVFGDHGKDKPEVPLRRIWTLRALAPLVDVFVAVADSLGNRLEVDVGIPRSRIAVIHNGVDVRRFAPRDDRAELRRALGYEAGQRVIGSVGRLHAVKDFVGLIAAFATLSKRRTDARLLIVGEGPERANLEREIVRRHLEDVVRLPGQQDRVEDWLQVMDVFVSASRSEGMPNNVLEAMAVGLPVVATRAGGLVELVSNGETGSIVEIGDTTALGEAMERYCDDADLCAAHGAAGRRRVRDELSSQRMIGEYCNLYERLLATRRVRRRLAAAGEGS